VMVAANVVVAEREADARRLFTPSSRCPCTLFAAVRLHYRNPWTISTRGERSGDRSHKSYVHVLVRRHAGDVTSELQGFLKMTRADELIMSNPIFDHAARLRSLELTALIRDSERSG